SGSHLGRNFTGRNRVPLCDPSQKGCVLLRPQVHQKKGAAAVVSVIKQGFSPPISGAIVLGALSASFSICPKKSAPSMLSREKQLVNHALIDLFQMFGWTRSVCYAVCALHKKRRQRSVVK